MKTLNNLLPAYGERIREEVKATILSFYCRKKIAFAQLIAYIFIILTNFFFSRTNNFPTQTLDNKEGVKAG